MRDFRFTKKLFKFFFLYFATLFEFQLIQRQYQNYTASVSELYSVGIRIIQRRYRNYTASVSELYSVGIRITQRRYRKKD